MKLNYLTTAIVLVTTVISGCASVKADKISNSDHLNLARESKADLEVNQEPIRGILSLSEAMVRSIYNGDYRVLLAEKNEQIAIALRSKKDLLPALTASVGAFSRSNELASSSINSETGEVSLVPSISTERNQALTSLAVSGSLLDWGVSYYMAKNEANSVLIREEQKRNGLQDIARDVKYSYLRSAVAKEIKQEVNRAIIDLNAAVTTIEGSEGYQRNSKVFLDNHVKFINHSLTLNKFSNDLDKAYTQLKALINTTDQIQVEDLFSDDRYLVDMGPITASIDSMEISALTYHPTMREENINVLIARNEAKQNLLSIFPGISFVGGVNYDSNEFLVNNSFSNVSFNLSANIANLFKVPAVQKQNVAREAQVQARRRALTMSLITRVHTNVANYEISRISYLDSKKLYDAISRKHMASVVRGDSVYEELDHRVQKIIAKARMLFAYADYRRDIDNVMIASGIDLLPVIDETQPIAVLTPIVSEYNKNLWVY